MGKRGQQGTTVYLPFAIEKYSLVESARSNAAHYLTHVPADS